MPQARNGPAPEQGGGRLKSPPKGRYVHPPFNSKATYNVLYKEKSGEQSTAQVKAFEDTWEWGLESEKTFHEIVTTAPKKLSDLIQAFRSFLGRNDMMAYLRTSKNVL
jgi:site-specific DNA-methyltransferase (adenine-specific)